MGFIQEIANEITQRGFAAELPAPADSAVLVAGAFVEGEPNGVQIRLMETGSIGDGIRVHDRAGVAYSAQTMQIMVRGATYQSAREKTQQLYDFFNGVIRNTTLSGTYYIGIDVLQEPAQLARDENDRWYFGFNLVARKRPS